MYYEHTRLVFTPSENISGPLKTVTRYIFLNLTRWLLASVREMDEYLRCEVIQQVFATGGGEPGQSVTCVLKPSKTGLTFLYGN